MFKHSIVPDSIVHNSSHSILNIAQFSQVSQLQKIAHRLFFINSFFLVVVAFSPVFKIYIFTFSPNDFSSHCTNLRNEMNKTQDTTKHKTKLKTSFSTIYSRTLLRTINWFALDPRMNRNQMWFFCKKKKLRKYLCVCHCYGSFFATNRLYYYRWQWQIHSEQCIFPK